MSWPVRTENPATGASGDRRVLHVITRLDRGGSADNTILSCMELAELGWSITLAYGETVDPSPRLQELRERPAVRCIEIPELKRAIRPVADLRAYRKLRRLLAEGDYDLVHTHSSKAGLLGRRAAHGLRCRVVHTPHGHVFHGYFGAPSTLLFLALERRAAAWCDRIVVLTDRSRGEHLERRVGRADQFVTIPSGVATAWFRHGLPDGATARRELGLPEDAFVVGSVARLTSIKGLSYLLEAAASLVPGFASLRVLLVGDGEERAALEEQAASGPLRGRVVFTGMIEDPRPALAAMDLFVMPSLNEGQSRAVVEAMAAGVPVIASGVGGLPEVLAGGAAGKLVPPADSSELAAAIQEVAGSSEERNGLIRAGLQRAGQYDEGTMIQRLDDLYRELLP